jgi:hypothetical protein
MLEKRRNGRVSTKTSIEDEIAHLRGLDLKGLRSRWQSVFQSPPPDQLNLVSEQTDKGRVYRIKDGKASLAAADKA